MAYLADEEDQKQQGQQGGSGVISGSSGQGNAGAAPDAGAPTSSGQFVNLQSYLGANSSANRVANVNKAANSAMNTISSGFDAASKPLKDASGSGTTYDQGTINGMVDKAAGGDSDALKSLSSAANQTYTGPTSVDYTPDAGAVSDLGNLQNANTIADTVAKGSIANGTYSLGDRNFDSALYTADNNVANASKGIGDKFGTLNKYIGDQTTALNAKGAGLAKSYDDARNSVRNELGTYQGQLQSGVDQQVAAAQAAHDKLYNNGKPGFDPNAGQTHYQYSPDGQQYRAYVTQPQWHEDGPINAGTVMSQGDSNKFATLAGLIGGDPNYTKTGNAQLGSWSQTPVYGAWQTAPETKDGPAPLNVNPSAVPGKNNGGMATRPRSKLNDPSKKITVSRTYSSGGY